MYMMQVGMLLRPVYQQDRGIYASDLMNPIDHQSTSNDRLKPVLTTGPEYWPAFCQPCTFTTFWANSTDDKFKIFLFYPENRFKQFRQVESREYSLHEMSEPIFREKEEKYHQFVVFWISPENGKG